MFLNDSLACKSSTATATKTFFLFSSGDLASLARAFLMTSILLLLSANAVFAWSEAESEYMKQATSEPHVNVGMANLECKHYKDAINEFTAAIKENPKMDMPTAVEPKLSWGWDGFLKHYLILSMLFPFVL